MLAEKVKLQELLDDVLDLIQIKSVWESNKSRQNSLKIKKITKKIQNTYLKTSNADTVLDLINTISNNNDIVDLKPSNITDLIIEDKEIFMNTLKNDTTLLNNFFPKDFIIKLFSENEDIMLSYIQKKEYSFLYKKNPDKYYELVKLYSAYHGFSDDIHSEEYLLPLIEEAFLDNSLPKYWELCFDDENQRYYYYNSKDDKSSWINPQIEVWKDKINKKREESESKKNKRYIKIKRDRKKNGQTPIKINDEDILIDLENYNFSDSDISKSPSSKDNSSEENSLRRSPRIIDKTKKKSFYNEL
jgi:hypothetical protein